MHESTSRCPEPVLRLSGWTDAPDGDHGPPNGVDPTAELLRWEHYLRFQIETLDLIAQHAPIDRTLETICELVEHTLPGSAAIVLVTDDAYPLRVFTCRSIDPSIVAEVVARMTPAFDRLAIVPDTTDELVVNDPTSDASTIRCIPVVGLGSVPLGGLCVHRVWSDPPDERARILLHHSSRLVQIAVEQHLAERRVIGMLATERQQIAGVMHDDPVQAVTAVSLVLQRLAMEVPSEQAGLLEQARSMVDGANERMRRMMFELHPSSLEEEGLAVAVEVYLEETFDRLGVRWSIDDRMERAPDGHLAALAYRLVHEALANVAAHASAASVGVELASGEGGLLVRVVDDGVGFDPDAVPRNRPGHLGLHSAQDLARRASGRMAIESSPGAGCTVDIWLPYLAPV